MKVFLAMPKALNLGFPACTILIIKTYRWLIFKGKQKHFNLDPFEF